MAELVECHSGHEYAERPVAFQWQGQRLEVAEILGRWRTPSGKAFQVLTSNQQVFVLSYYEQEESWEVSQP